MGVDTRFWGPSGWQLFHLIAFRSDHPKKALELMKTILPCKFCRESTTEFVKEHPLEGDVGKWLYEIHNMVNDKLRTQCKDNPEVINPGPDPTFEEVKARYASLKLTDIPGRDFLFSVASNYPESPTSEDMDTQKNFMDELAQSYPFDKVRKAFQSYMKTRPIELHSKKDYMKWMYGLLYRMGQVIDIEIPSYKGYVQRVMYYTSGCDKKTYKGKTCRRVDGGGFTKNRDHKRTRKITQKSLL
jgi:hypothetical protein